MTELSGDAFDIVVAVEEATEGTADVFRRRLADLMENENKKETQTQTEKDRDVILSLRTVSSKG